jgi:hypothetical protein
MKKAVLWVSVAVAAFVVTGCKSDVEKMADEVCECKDKKCLEDVSAKYKDKMPKDEKKELTGKDKEAADKMAGCMLKLAFGDK